jgi:transposase
VFERFHVQRLTSDAIETVRRSEVRSAVDEAIPRVIKRSRYALLESPWNMRRGERQKIADIQAKSERLLRARLLNNALADALAYRQPKRARRPLDQWLSWASRSKLDPFVRLARTIRENNEGMLAYIKDLLTNGSVEGINNLLRMIAHGPYGLHSADSLILMLILFADRIEVNAPLPTHRNVKRDGSTDCISASLFV